MTTLVKKKPVNSKRKGASNELALAKLLTKTFEAEGLHFRRSERSGAVVGGLNVRDLARYDKAGQAMLVGDVVPTNEAEAAFTLRVVIEAKAYKTQPTLTQLLTGSHLMLGWYEEAVVDAAKLDRTPVLIFKFNNTPWMVLTEERPQVPSTSPRLQLTATHTIYHLVDVLTDRDFWLVPKAKEG